MSGGWRRCFPRCNGFRGKSNPRSNKLYEPTHCRLIEGRKKNAVTWFTYLLTKVLKGLESFEIEKCSSRSTAVQKENHAIVEKCRMRNRIEHIYILTLGF